MSKSFKAFLLLFLIFFAIIFVLTFRLLGGFFEQDEWMGLADVMHAYNYPWWYPYLPWVHFSPIAVLLWTTFYKLFHLQAQYYFLIELAVHAACSALVYILTLKVCGKKSVALLTSLLFLTNSRAHQAFTHLAIFHTTDITMFFILLFTIYLSSITNRIVSFKNTLILLILFLGALLTREEGLIIIPIAVTYIACFDRRKINKKNFIPVFVFCIAIVAYIALRIFAQSLNTNPVPKVYQVTGSGAEYNLATLPIKAIVQNLVWSERFAQFFVVNTQKLYPNVESFFIANAPIMDAGFFYIFSLMLIIFTLWLTYVRPKNMGRILIFLSVWLMADVFILSFIGRHISVIEPRYLYYSSFPVFFLVALFIYTLLVSDGKWKVVNLSKKIFAITILIFLFSTSYKEIRVAVWRQVIDGQAKRKLIESLLTVHPTLSNETIFYIKCKGECHRNATNFGIPNKNVLPFSSGPGMNLLIVYASKQGQEKEWGPFLTENFLFNTFAEGYKKVGDRSYGYFTTKSKLKKTLQKYNLSKSRVTALEYDEDKFTFRDISPEFRKSL